MEKPKDKLNKEIIEHITDQANSIDFGEIKLTLNKNANYIDVIAEKRKRFVITHDYKQG